MSLQNRILVLFVAETLIIISLFFFQIILQNYNTHEFCVTEALIY